MGGGGGGGGGRVEEEERACGGSASVLHSRLMCAPSVLVSARML